MENFPEIETIETTTLCSAGCRHCPYGRGDAAAKHMPVEEIAARASGSPCRLVVFAGGEPFEHPGIIEMLERAAGLAKLYRFATGGHIPLDRFVPYLLKSASFSGVSLGTDILIEERNSSAELRRVWLRNARLLERAGVGYSVTITVSEGLDLDALLSKLAGYALSPDFYFIRAMAGAAAAAAACAGRLRAADPRVKIIFS